MDLNKLAERIVEKEGKKINLSIAQVKEVLSITLDELAALSMIDVIYLLFERRRKYNKDRSIKKKWHDS